ncbi:sperm-associated antigen 1 [Ascaphus truei]|uniref:sperm-associated antigen 1 n=1 Tax=Ascaphus truei TaxID=8439 RepID=UPI003F59E424
MSAQEVSSVMNFGTTKTYEIPIDHLDYSFIKKCTDVKHLEKILRILRSGEEGHYPDLTAFCEKQIESLAPHSRALRKDKPAATAANFSLEEWQHIDNDLKVWTFSPVAIDAICHRNCRFIALHLCFQRFDVETELSKINANSEEKEASQTVINSRASKIEKAIDTAGVRQEQRSVIANHEKEKGNEAFRCGDYEEAVCYYSRSISVLPSSAAYNNRAQAEIKRKNWQNALNDCEKVLDLEPSNLKALLRRATVHKNLCNYRAAAVDLRRVLHHEPDNAAAKKILVEVDQKLQVVEEEAPRKGKRIIIQDIEGSDEEEGGGKASYDQATAPLSCTHCGLGHLVAAFSPLTYARWRIVVTHPAPGSCQRQPPRHEEAGVTVVGGGGEAAGELSNMGNAQRKFPPKGDGWKSEERQTPKHRATSENGVKKGSPTGGGARKEPQRAATPEAEMRPKGGSKEVRKEQPSAPLPAAARLKEDGNQLFRNGQFGEAAAKYSEAIGNVPDTGAEERSILYSNRAACYLKDGNCTDCIEDCNKALELQPFSIKPLLRRAMANESLERYRQAYVDYKTALQIDSGLQVANDSINRITRTLIDQDGPKWREKLPPIPSVPISIQLQRREGIFAPSVNVQGVKPGENIPSEAMTGEVAKKKFLSLKQEGNEHVKKGQYREAEKKYTECLKLNPEECSVYTNRALCYLKLSQYEEARHDSDCALQRDALNIKALYRRAQAHRGLENYHDCASDLKKMISVDPSVTEAKKLLDEITPLLTSAAVSEKQRKKILIQEVYEKDGSAENDEAVSMHHSPHENNVPLATTAKAQITKPSNAYEFGQLINEIKAEKDMAACAELLSLIEPKDLPALLSNKLEGDTFLLIVQSLKDSLLDKDPRLTYQYLSHLSKAERFKVVMLLSKNEKDEVKSLFEALLEKRCEHVYPEDVLRLSKEYGL